MKEKIYCIEHFSFEFMRRLYSYLISIVSPYCSCNFLLIAPDDSDFDSTEKGIRWLIQNQTYYGYWDGGYFGITERGRKEDIYATDMAILALQRYRALKACSDLFASFLIPKQE